MQIKKDIPLFVVLAFVFTGLLLNGRATNKPCLNCCIKTSPSGKCTQQLPVQKTSSPLNFITRGIFHIPS